MKEIISSILQAEEMANQIISDANLKAQKASAERDAKRDDAKSKATVTFALERKKALRDAEETAKEKYACILDGAKKESETLSQSAKDKIEKIASEIVSELIK